MERKMRRQDRLATAEETAEILNEALYGILSTSDNENLPYGVPLSYVYVNGYIYFHCAKEGRKLDNMAQNSHVCFTAVSKAETLADKFSVNFRSAVVEGKAEKVEDEKERLTAFTEIIKKYSQNFIKEGMEYIEKGASAALIYKIVPENVSGKLRR